MPFSCCGPYRCPSDAAYATSGLVGWTLMRAMRPVFSRPTRAQLFPASVDLYMPQPIEMWLRVYGSPVPAYTTFGSLGATAMDPTDCTGCASKSDVQWMPPSVDFHSPPDAAPA